MPDLVTHTAIPWLFHRLFRIRVRTEIFLLGLILPDLLSRSLNYLLIRWWAFVGDFTRPFHSPLIMLACCFGVSLLFDRRERAEVFLLLLTGSVLHLLFDLLQYHIGVGYLVLFPFSRYEFNHGLFWPEDTLYIVAPLMALVGAVKLRDRIRKRRRQS